MLDASVFMGRPTALSVFESLSPRTADYMALARLVCRLKAHADRDDNEYLIGIEYFIRSSAAMAVKGAPLEACAMIDSGGVY